MILAFKFFPHIQSDAVQHEKPQELFKVEDIQQTRQETTPPPPPPKPSMIVEAVTEDDLTDIEFGDTEIDLDQELLAPPPPPPSKEDAKILEEEPVYFVAVEEMPYPIGGIKAIHDLIVYPEIAKRAGIEGKVYVMAYVNEKGNVTKTEVVKGIGAGCDEAAVKAIEQTRFSPGKQRGRSVKVKIMIPVIFKLTDKPV
jgi:protein TonB